MTMFVVLAVVLAAVAVAWLTRPLWRSPVLTAVIGVFLVALAGIGYFGIGSLPGVTVAPGMVTAQAPAASTPSMEQVAEIVDRALKADPKNPRALALAGAIAYDKGDYALAVRHWETLAQIEPPDTPAAQQLRDHLAEARKRAGLPPSAVAAAPRAPASAPAASAHAQVSGTVRLAPSLQARVGPEDSVFVFARAAEGQRVPLAVLRRQAKDLPLTFTLDDSLAMSPAATLSGASRVVVGARISKGGSAMARPGDLQGFSAPIAVGERAVAIEINEEVK